MTLPWGYYDLPGQVPPSAWGTRVPGASLCASRPSSIQSPIDIESAHVHSDKALPSLRHFYHDCVGCHLKNNGRTVQLDYSDHDTETFVHKKLKYDGANIGSIPRINFEDQERPEYHLLQTHFHWGEDHTRGSEHTVGDRAFPLEMHMVHAQRGVQAPTHTPGALLVLAVFFQIGAPNPSLAHITNAVARGDVRSADSHTTIRERVCYEDLLPADVDENYATYKGSLTTPTCNEVVNWVIAGSTMTLSEEQLLQLRQAEMFKGQPITHNYRLAQPLHGRQIRSTKDGFYEHLYREAKDKTPASELAPVSGSGQGQVGLRDEGSSSGRGSVQVEREDDSVPVAAYVAVAEACLLFGGAAAMQIYMPRVCKEHRRLLLVVFLLASSLLLSFSYIQSCMQIQTSGLDLSESRYQQQQGNAFSMSKNCECMWCGQKLRKETHL